VQGSLVRIRVADMIFGRAMFVQKILISERRKKDRKKEKERNTLLPVLLRRAASPLPTAPLLSSSHAATLNTVVSVR